jgi:primosomal protein N' (replication factor Y)
MPYADIAVAAPTISSFTYEIPSELCDEVLVGSRLAVPFRRRKVVGYVLNLTDRLPADLDKEKIRPIDSILDDAPIFSENFLRWLKWISSYYCAPIGEVCRAALPSRLNRISPPKTSRPVLPREMEQGKKHERVVLTPDQDSAIDVILGELNSATPKPCLLHGITGSGKTEIYLSLFEKLREEGGQGIMLIPEIGLTPQLSARVVERFGQEVALYHSGLSDAQRHYQWERMRKGEVTVVVGTRSALFAPLPNLRAIVVDEEHDPSYKQDEGVLYNARDSAVMRAHIEKAVVVLGSATPAMESFANSAASKYHYISLPERTGGGVLPEVELVDMRKQSFGDKKKSVLSSRLAKAIEETLERGEQAMIFLNRRGFAHFLICEECGHTFECPNCDISLSYHHSPSKLLCHYCDYSITPPNQCPGCQGVNIVPMGRGTERIEMELTKLFPKARIARLDRDSISKAKTRTQIFRRMHKKEIDILVGTQMIAKGHDFPHITLVGIVSADVALHMPDFRSAERTFQLITQVSGRAGRSEKGGRVILQTYQPEHTSLVHASAHDYDAFYNDERSHREMLRYPPYARLANIRVSASDKEKLKKFAKEIAKRLKAGRDEMKFAKSIVLLGPAPAPMEKIRNRYRWQILIKARSAKELGAYLSSTYPRLNEFQSKGLRIAIDVDPVNML